MSRTPTTPDAVRAHYGRADLEPAILDALRAAGHDPDRLSAEALPPLDQLHTGGVAATLALADLAGVRADDRVLDVGGGLGGPARTLAARVGCHVAVLDLTEALCAVGASLTRRVGLDDRVTFRVGDALAMPCGDASVDVVWTQHSTMNIPDKAQLYAEVRRVLRPGGRLAMHEIVAGPAPAERPYPLPWAAGPATSFLRSAADTRACIAGAGLVERVWHDVTAPSLAWLDERAAARPAGRPDALGPHVVLGAQIGAALRNCARALAAGTLAVVEAVFERP